MLPTKFQFIGLRGCHDHMVEGFTTTYAIIVYHHSSGEFEFRSGEVYLIQLDMMKFSMCTPVSSTNKTDRHNITEILLKVTLNTISPPIVAVIFLYTSSITL